jgi:glutamate N-acetyltransferase/amino-acid N-acetyltransferase
MAAGKAGVALDLERLEVRMAGIPIASHGALHTEALADAAARMKDREFALTIDLKVGTARASVVTCDFSYDYVKINAEYTT